MLFWPHNFFSVRFNVVQRSFQTTDFTLLGMAGRMQGLFLHNNLSLVSQEEVYILQMFLLNGMEIRLAKTSGWPFLFSYQTSFACKILVMLVSYV